MFLILQKCSISVVRKHLHIDVGVAGFFVVGTIRGGQKITTVSPLGGAVFDFLQILAYLLQNMSRSQLYLGFDHYV